MAKNNSTLKISRREFIKIAGSAGSGFLLAVFLDACSPSDFQQVQESLESTGLENGTWTPNIYLRLDDEGKLTVIAFRSEMGQGIRTATAMIIAEELDLPWKDVLIKQAPADSRYGNQVTGGSQSISDNYDRLREAGATARQLLVIAASQIWGVEASTCQTDKGFVIHPDQQQTLAYGDLVSTAAELETPRDIEFKGKSQLQLVGQDIGHWDTNKILTGQAVYGFDVRLPDMSYAVLSRSPVFGGSLVSYNDSAALQIPGVQQVIELNDKVAVVADNSWAAIQGRNALTVTWDDGPNAQLSSAEITESALSRLPEPGTSTDNTLEAYYQIPYQAHATMEPMNCTAFVSENTCEIWAPTQNPQEVQLRVSIATKIKRSQVTVNLPLLGGGFGRRLEADYAVEAAQLSQVLNAPVQVFWTRDDDLQHDYYHMLNVQYFKSSLDNLQIPRGRIIEAGSAIPTGAWRSVGNFSEAFGVQCFLDEMAAALKRDPLEIRLELYEERSAEVIKLAAEKANWGDPLPDGWGRGLAFHATFGVTHVAQVAEVSVGESGDLRVQRVICAVDCGQVINPDTVAAQMEGGIVFGLTAALKSQAIIKDGRVMQSNFHDYPLLQMSEMPEIEVYLVESDHPPSGIGEMGVPPVAPALANAVFAATGKRIRHIPIMPEDLV